MPEKKFNPIANLPLLPGSEASVEVINKKDDAELEADVIDATYPPIEPLNKDLKKPQIEIRPVEEDPEDPIVIEKEKEHTVATRLGIIIGLIVFIFLGIFLTLAYVPRIANNVANFNKSVTSIFVSKKTAEAPVTTVPVATKPVATSTPATVSTMPLVIITATTTQPTVTPQPAVTLQPAKLVASIISTDAVGNRESVRFNIQNVGEKTSGVWSFAVTLPSNSTPKYYSVAQAPLAPKSGVIYTLGFTADQDLPIQITLYN